MLVAQASYAAVIFEDDFEYVANRNVTDVQIPFEAAGWTDAKATNSDYGGSGGYLYTLDNTPLNSKVLVMESLPTTVGGQTSYHLQYGDSTEPEGTIPANVWFQFWTYATPGSQFERQKFLYPCHQAYNCPTETYLWILYFQESDLTGVGDEVVTAATGGRFFRLQSAYSNYSGGETWNAAKLFQNVSHTEMAVSTWYLVKLHIDTSGAQGTYEVWIRARGTPTWTKLAEWIGGTTPNFDWPIPANQRNGNRVLAIPTTVDTYDSTTYMDDFVMATTEEDLPTYGDATGDRNFSPVLNLRVAQGEP